MRAPLLQADGLTIEVRHRHGRASVVRDVTLAVGAGEALGLVGESGSGKSLTLRALLGLLPTGVAAVAGTVAYRDVPVVEGGRVTRAMRPLRGTEIGMVFQDPTSALDPVRRVGDQIGERVRRHTDLGRRAAKERAVELMASMGIPDARRRRDQFPHEFSGGMRQRVMIAMAIACGPSLLLCDEPTTALDVTTQQEILKLLRALRDTEGLALIFVSHDLGVIAETCDRVCVMYCGEIVEVGDCREVFNSPAHPYTLGLREAAPDIDAASAVLHAIPGEAPDPTIPPPGCHFHPRCSIAIEQCYAGAFPLLQPVPGRQTACIRHQVCTNLVQEDRTEARQ